MATTQKRIHLSLTKENLRELDLLCNHFGENKSEVIKRALIILHYITFNKNEDK